MIPFKWPRFLNKRTVNNKSNLQLIRNQIDFFWSSRLRRSFQIYNFYRNLWDEKALREFLKQMRNNILNRNRKLLLSTVGLFFFDWDKERIKIDDNLKEFFDEFEWIECLKSKAAMEQGGMMKSQTSCQESTFNKHNYAVNGLESWEFYVQKDNMITWRREEEDGHYAYKVYVSYPDITAEDFLFVQTNIEYRREWDDTAVVLDVIDSDKLDGVNSKVIYWEMRWPNVFSNRDYVFVRKHFIDNERNLILIVNKSTKHPSCPVNPKLQRVKEYWSFMVIKPKTTFAEPGLEFILTYFDNPGIRIPTSVTSWVAKRQLPDFIKTLYYATVKYANKKTMAKWGKNNDPDFEYPCDIRLDEFEQMNSGDEQENMDDNVNKKHDSKISSDNSEIDESEEEETQPNAKSWWSYLLPYNYLH